MRAEGEDIRCFSNARELRATEQLNRQRAFEAGEVQAGMLREARKISHHQNHFVLISAYKGQHTMIFRIQELECASTKRLIPFTERDEPFSPPENRVRIVLLSFDVVSLVVKLWINHDGQV